MNVSIISTYGRKEKKAFCAQRLKGVLIELAESELYSPEYSHLISREGVEKVKRKLG